MTSIQRALISAIALMAISTPSAAFGQTTTTGAILGSVTDPRGAVVAGATVTTTNLQTNEKRIVRTNLSGSYSVPSLPVGSYRVRIQAPGFTTFEQGPVAVDVTERVTVSAQLKVGSVSESVTVSGQPTMLQTASPTHGALLGSQTISNMPLATRNFTQLIALSPGVATSVPNAAGFGLNTIELSSEGARAADNSVEINGIDSMNMFTNSMGSYVGAQGIAVPAPDTLEEFKVQTALYSAATGRNGGANVAVVTKSGTNHFHGGLYEYVRNEALNANDFFLNRAGVTRPELRQNQFGGTFGGPIQKDKTFFFISYQGTRQVNGVTGAAQSTAFLPPLGSDRSAAALGAIFGGQKGFASLFPGGAGTAVAKDGSNINPVALALLNAKFPNGQFVIPSPQLPTGQTNFVLPARFNGDQFNTNLDRFFGQNNSISIKYFYATQNSFLPFNEAAAALPGFGRIMGGGNRNLSGSYIHLFGAALINTARFGYTYMTGVSSGQNKITAASVGMITPPTVVDLPAIGVVGMFTAGDNHNADQGTTTKLFSYADSLSYVHGRHTIQAGAEIKHALNPVFDHVEAHPVLTFLDFPSFLLGQSATQNGTPFSHVAAIVAASISPNENSRDYRDTDVAAYFQDDFRVLSSLTLDAGLRWEFFGVPVDAQGRNSNFDFSRALAVPPPTGTNSGFVVGADTPGTLPPDVVRAQNDTLRNTENLKNVEPRLGFAWQQSRKIVVRGGYGIYFSRRAAVQDFQNNFIQPFAFVSNVSLQPGSTTTFQNPLPPLPPPSAFPLFVPRTITSRQSVEDQDPNMSVPYTQQYSLGVQYEVARDTILEASYVGSKTTHLIGVVSINQPYLASTSNPVNGITANTIQNAFLRVPYQGLDPRAAQVYSNGFSSNYNSLQVDLRRRFSHALEFSSAYTWSKSLDDVAQGSGPFLSANTVLGDQRNPSQNYGPSDYDRTQRWISSVVWQTPSFSTWPTLLRILANGWEFAGIFTLQTGLALTVVDSSAATIFGQVPSRAQFALGANPITARLSGSVESSLNRYFNTSAFTTAPVIGNGTGFGNSGRGIFRGPGQQDLDFALMRNFKFSPLGEAGELQFRAEAFNLTNTPNFGNPGLNRAAPASFGIIGNTTVNPRVLQLALKVTF